MESEKGFANTTWDRMLKDRVVGLEYNIWSNGGKEYRTEIDGWLAREGVQEKEYTKAMVLIMDEVLNER